MLVGERIYTYVYSIETGYELAYFDPSLPATDRSGTPRSTLLVLLAALTAAAGIAARRAPRQVSSEAPAAE